MNNHKARTDRTPDRQINQLVVDGLTNWQMDIKMGRLIDKLIDRWINLLDS